MLAECNSGQLGRVIDRIRSLACATKNVVCFPPITAWSAELSKRPAGGSISAKPPTLLPRLRNWINGRRRHQWNKKINHFIWSFWKLFDYNYAGSYCFRKEIISSTVQLTRMVCWTVLATVREIKLLFIQHLSCLDITLLCVCFYYNFR